MRRLWLIFAQAVTVALALLFVVSTLKPEWISQTPQIVTLAPSVPPAALPKVAAPAVATTVTSDEMK